MFLSPIFPNEILKVPQEHPLTKPLKVCTSFGQRSKLWPGPGLGSNMNSLTFLPPTNSSSKGILKANGNLALKKGGGLKSTQTKIHFATLKKKTEKKTHSCRNHLDHSAKCAGLIVFLIFPQQTTPSPPPKKKNPSFPRKRDVFFGSKKARHLMVMLVRMVPTLAPVIAVCFVCNVLTVHWEVRRCGWRSEVRLVRNAAWGVEFR